MGKDEFGKLPDHLLYKIRTNYTPKQTECSIPKGTSFLPTWNPIDLMKFVILHDLTHFLTKDSKNEEALSEIISSWEFVSKHNDFDEDTLEEIESVAENFQHLIPEKEISFTGMIPLRKSVFIFSKSLNSLIKLQPASTSLIQEVVDDINMLASKNLELEDGILHDCGEPIPAYTYSPLFLTQNPTKPQAALALLSGYKNSKTYLTI